MARPTGDPVVEIREAVRGVGLWGAFPWAFTSSLVCGVGVALAGWARAPFLGWIVAGVGWVLLGFLGLGGVVTKPWWRALGGVVIGELTALALVGAHVAALAALASPGFGGPEIALLVAGASAAGGAGLWAWVRWGASPLAAVVGAVWAAALAFVPGGLAALVALLTAPPAS